MDGEIQRTQSLKKVIRGTSGGIQIKEAVVAL
jgi:hypothetical protein